MLLLLALAAFAVNGPVRAGGHSSAKAPLTFAATKTISPQASRRR
jgi:hypothetical protein